LRDGELQLEVARARRTFPAAGELQLEAPERAVDAGEAGDHFRQSAERRALRAELERDGRHRCGAVEIEPPCDRHLADDRL
jgi:hypothetical protein